MEGGEASLRHQLRDQLDAGLPVVVGVGAGDQSRDDVVGALRDEAGEFAVFAVELAALGVGGLGGHLRQRERARIVDAGVAAPVADYRRVVRHRLVQVEPVEGPAFGELGVVVLEAADPLAGWRLAGAGRHALLDLGDAAHVDVDVLEFAHSGARRVGVRVDEAGGDDGVAVVEDLGPLTAQGFDVGPGADGHEAPILHREGFGGGNVVVHGVDEAAVHDEVGGGGGRRAGPRTTSWPARSRSAVPLPPRLPRRPGTGLG